MAQGMLLSGISEEIDELIRSGLVRPVGESATVPAGIPVLTIEQLRQKFGTPIYKKWWFWAGTATLLGGAFLLFRRRK